MSDCHVIKLLMLGDGAVGKSQLLTRYVEARFVQNFVVSIGVDTRQKTIAHKGNKVKVQVWDAAGNKTFQTVTPDYYRAAHGIIIVYDITNETSFANVERWYREVQQHCAVDTPVIVVGNKTDLVDAHMSSLRIPREKEQDLSAKLGVMLFSASARNGSGVAEAFSEIIDLVFLQRFVPYGAILTESKNSERATGCARLWSCFRCRQRPGASAPSVEVSSPAAHQIIFQQVQPPEPACAETSKHRIVETGILDAGTSKKVEIDDAQACDVGSAHIDSLTGAAHGADGLHDQGEAAVPSSFSWQDENSSTATPHSSQPARPEPLQEQADQPSSHCLAPKELQEFSTMREDLACQSMSRSANGRAIMQAEGQSISSPCQIFVDLLCSSSCNHDRAGHTAAARRC